MLGVRGPGLLNQLPTLSEGGKGIDHGAGAPAARAAVHRRGLANPVGFGNGPVRFINVTWLLSLSAPRRCS